MRMPVQIHFRDMDASEAMESLLREKLEGLAQIEPRATSCHVVIEPTDKRHRHGTIHRITVRLAVPGDELVVSRESGEDHSHEDPYVALRDAVDALRRQVVERNRMRRGA
ncbi:HPF/RaiA family ribosome-associated protein [Sandaracinus amylolyticus]|uniref:HPF/RaiA family ribosome-associated protein n=1 Tax=Sandaracinus amylolyticus TaxID=927083 RepID=UPI00069E6094|nr:HPF/RaiA family ribosome-associated protein [Sandaracinus amylolyticus]